MLWFMCYPVAERISAERGEAVGDTVGYKVLTNYYIFL
jgi:HrpA-like RNA helicase